MLIVFEGIAGVGTYIVCNKLGECLENSRVFGIPNEIFGEMISQSKKFSTNIELNVEINYIIACKMIAHLRLLDSIFRKEPDKIYIVNKYYYNLIAYQISGFLKINNNFKNHLFKVMCRNIDVLVARISVPDCVFHLKSNIYGGKDALYGLSVSDQNRFLTRVLSTAQNCVVINHNSNLDQTVFAIKSAILKKIVD